MTRVQITRLLPAEPGRVWAALTQAEALTAWFWPARLGPKITVDLREGGVYRIEAAEMAVSGEYREIDVPRRLVFTWHWDGEVEESLVTIELNERDGKTELVLQHERLADEQTSDLHAQGWNDCLDRLMEWA